MFAFVIGACSLVSIPFCLGLLALLIVVSSRMFSHHVYLEVRRCGALVVAVSAGKRLLTSVRSHVLF